MQIVPIICPAYRAIFPRRIRASSVARERPLLILPATTLRRSLPIRPNDGGQGEAGGAGLGDDLSDRDAERLQLRDEQLGVGRLDLGGQEAAAVAEEGDVVGGLVGVDADVEDLAVVVSGADRVTL
jgi:hypothetical protein